MVYGYEAVPPWIRSGAVIDAEQPGKPSFLLAKALSVQGAVELFRHYGERRPRAYVQGEIRGAT